MGGFVFFFQWKLWLRAKWSQLEKSWRQWEACSPGPNMSRFCADHMRPYPRSAVHSRRSEESLQGSGRVSGPLLAQKPSCLGSHSPARPGRATSVWRQGKTENHKVKNKEPPLLEAVSLPSLMGRRKVCFFFPAEAAEALELLKCWATAMPSDRKRCVTQLRLTAARNIRGGFAI